MNDSSPIQRADAGGHLSEWTMEQLAEGVLPAAEAASATRHVDACARCAAELDAYRSLCAVLSELPRFAPSPVFADAVMARVQIAPGTSPALAWVQDRLPATRRGWTMLVVAIVAPALPLLALLAWLLSNPLISPAGLWQWGSSQAQGAGQTLLSYALTRSAGSEVVSGAQAVWSVVSSMPTLTIAGVLVFLAVAIPLSAWSLVRLVRTPMGNVTYAN